MTMRLKQLLTPIKVAFVCLALSACADTKQPFSSTAAASSQQSASHSGQRAVTIEGSIVDGPVDNRTITVRNTHGLLKKAFTEDGKGAFQLTTIFRDEDFPLLFTARDETQLLVVGDPGFTLLSAIIRPTIGQRVSISAYSTLITSVALKLPGGLTEDNMEKARDYVMATLDFGLYGAFKDDPIHTLTTPENIHVITKANETLSELIRRTSERLNISGYHMTTDDVISALAADLVDGRINGRGANGTRPRVSAMANFIAGQVALESITNELKVRNSVATPSLDYAILSIYPESRNRIRNVHLTDALMQQAAKTLNIAKLINPTPEIDQTLAGLEKLTSFMRPDRAKKILPATAGINTVLSEVSRRISLSSKGDIKQVNILASQG